MEKVFLYLYPIWECSRIFVVTDEDLEDVDDDEEELVTEDRDPFKVLNEAIDIRYRKNGYKIVYALYKDKEVYGLEVLENDKIIYTDTTFSESMGIRSDGSIKKNYEIKYPSEDYLLDQLEGVQELVVGGYHWSDCVKRVGERAIERGIDTLVDIELTDIFFGVYFQDYFKVEDYSRERYLNYRMDLDKMLGYDIDSSLESFYKIYESPVFGYQKVKDRKM